MLKLAPRLLHDQSGSLQGCLKWSSVAVSEMSQLQQVQYVQVVLYQNCRMHTKGGVKLPEARRVAGPEPAIFPGTLQIFD
jgi:hypothetical protein